MPSFHVWQPFDKSGPLRNDPCVESLWMLTPVCPPPPQLCRMRRATSSSMETPSLTTPRTITWQEQCSNTEDQATPSPMDWSISSPRARPSKASTSWWKHTHLHLHKHTHTRVLFQLFLWTKEWCWFFWWSDEAVMCSLWMESTTTWTGSCLTSLTNTPSLSRRPTPQQLRAWPQAPPTATLTSHITR